MKYNDLVSIYSVYLNLCLWRTTHMNCVNNNFGSFSTVHLMISHGTRTCHSTVVGNHWYIHHAYNLYIYLFLQVQFWANRNSMHPLYPGIILHYWWYWTRWFVNWELRKHGKMTTIQIAHYLEISEEIESNCSILLWTTRDYFCFFNHLLCCMNMICFKHMFKNVTGIFLLHISNF